jgi:hypothetical protein
MSNLTSFWRRPDPIAAFYADARPRPSGPTDINSFATKAQACFRQQGINPAQGWPRLMNHVLDDAGHAPDLAAAHKATGYAIALLHHLGHDSEREGWAALGLDPRRAFFRIGSLSEDEEWTKRAADANAEIAHEAQAIQRSVYLTVSWAALPAQPLPTSGIWDGGTFMPGGFGGWTSSARAVIPPEAPPPRRLAAAVPARQLIHAIAP